MKTIFLISTVLLLLGGIIGSSFDVFNPQKQSKYVSNIIGEDIFFIEKMSIRQIDSLSAADNLSFTIKNALR